MQKLTVLISMLVAVGGGVMLISKAGQFDNPYNVYFHTIVPLCALWFVFRSIACNRLLAAAAFAAMAVLFSPFAAALPIRDELWLILEYGSAGIFLFHLFMNPFPEK